MEWRFVFVRSAAFVPCSGRMNSSSWNRRAYRRGRRATGANDARPAPQGASSSEPDDGSHLAARHRRNLDKLHKLVAVSSKAGEPAFARVLESPTLPRGDLSKSSTEETDITEGSAGRRGGDSEAHWQEEEQVGRWGQASMRMGALENRVDSRKGIRLEGLCVSNSAIDASPVAVVLMLVACGWWRFSTRLWQLVFSLVKSLDVAPSTNL